jgi:tetratricopeptide (TPR) repeat protein
MPESAFTRFWNTVKPPPAVKGPQVSPEVMALRKRQRRLILISVGVLVAIGAGVWVYIYISNAPQRADLEFQAGMKSMGPGKYPDAIAHFTKALSISGQLPNAYLERGNAYRSLGDMDAALADYQAAADMNPSLAAAHNGIAIIYVERKDTRHALEEFNKSLSLQPTVEAYYQRGQILEAQGEHEKAIADYDRAIAEQPDAPYMYRARALSKQNMGNLDGAHEDRMTAMQIEHH